MLIHALCDYYDILEKSEKILPEGYSNVKIHYLVNLNKNGEIVDITNCQERTEKKTEKGKIKESWTPRNTIMPQRTEKPGIDANIVEHRPLYLFGLNLENGELSSKDRTNKAEKSHEAFVKENLEFLEGLESPLIDAFRQFLLSWQPEKETENRFLLGLGKEYPKSGFAFCLLGFPEFMLHDEFQIKEKWQQKYQKMGEHADRYISQCAVSGEQVPIARIHNKIKGVYGGLATGSVLIGFNNASENSYGKEQSYNSNISEAVMKKYTETLNYLLGNEKHKALLDDITIVFWAMDTNENCENFVMDMLFTQSEKLDAENTEKMIKSLMKDSQNGKITEARLESLDMIEPNVMFYMVGLKPNSSRLAVKFIYQQRFAQVLFNIARFQTDMQISEKLSSISIRRIKEELISPKSKTETVNPALIARLLESILYGENYPLALLEAAVRRVKTDRENKINKIRAGIIKACINRNYKKEELRVALDKQNNSQAYLCGRLFAVLEKLQQEASNNSLNRTIKDSYFASASSKPVTVFPKLIKLAQNHLNKVKFPVFYNKLIGEIIDSLVGEFPDNLDLADQGRFIVGYYQQYQNFFEKKEQQEEAVVEEKENGN